ncbi:MAG: hypothetical protein LPK13_10695, partial [Marinobacter sp.]|uniref:hypothetical protein n=1 Tax=Marinobacter sp. TaxID=50741 RepID=UPI0029C22717
GHPSRWRFADNQRLHLHEYVLGPELEPCFVNNPMSDAGEITPNKPDCQQSEASQKSDCLQEEGN